MLSNDGQCVAIQMTNCDLRWQVKRLFRWLGTTSVQCLPIPPGLITGLLGINVGGIPGVNSGWAFTIVCLILIGIAIVQAIVFKKMKWL